jgi:hypothetical protein
MYRTTDKAYIDDQIKDGVPAEIADVVVVSPNDPNAKRPFPPPGKDDTNSTIEINAGADNASIVDALHKIANSLINASGDPAVKTAEEERGSVPPVISPANRKAMGTFVVVNLSRSRNVDWVQFAQEDGRNGFKERYTINSVSMKDKDGTVVSLAAAAAQDRNAIALLQGTYQIIAGHGGNQTTAPKRGIIVPSNDPQSVVEHYIYFYKDKSGNYVINTNKPSDHDMDPTDVLPPSQGYGVGMITLVNRTNKAYLESVTLEARDHRDRGNKTYSYWETNTAPGYETDGFVRKTPVGPGQVNDVNVIGTPQFKVDGYFIASVTAVTEEGTAAVTRLIYLNNTIAEIIVTDNDVDIRNVPGARVKVFNNTTTSSVIDSVEIADKAAPANAGVFTTSVSNGNSTAFDVLNSTGMPVIENAVYKAKANITVSKQFTGTFVVNGQNAVDPVISKTGTIDVALSPDGKLYGKNGPASHVRTITVNEQDIAQLIPARPEDPPPPFTPVTDVVILNGTYTAADTVEFYAKDNKQRTIKWKIVPANATACKLPGGGFTEKAGYWTFGEADPNIVMAGKTVMGVTFPNPPVYGLGSAGKDHTDVDGRLTVRSVFNRNQLYIAYIVPNGKAPGARNPKLIAVGNMQGLMVDSAKDFYKVIKLVDTDPPIVVIRPPSTGSGGSGSGGSTSSGGSGTIRFVKDNDFASSMHSCWIYTMDSSYDNKFKKHQLESGDSGIPVEGAISYFKPPKGLTLYKEVSYLYKQMVNKGDHYDVNLPQGRYLITWLKTSSALHYGYDKQNWFVLDMPSHSDKSPIVIKVDTTGPDCTMRF